MGKIKGVVLRITGLFTLRRPLGSSGYGFARSIASFIPAQNLRYILSALVAYLRYDASANMPPQSPYSGWQNVIYSRNVMRNISCNYIDKYKN
jgi:hypothetical protein